MPRKQAFSGKQKKKQLQEKRDRKKDSHGIYDDDRVQDVSSAATSEGGQGQAEVLHVHQQPISGKDYDPNRYRLHFVKISEEEMRKRRIAARKPISKVPESALEMSVESVHPSEKALHFPKRPPWDFRLSKQQLDRQEQAYFADYVHTMLATHSAERLSYFELNLETWRQLWRVTEISDVLLLIADIRHPVLHLPPSLYAYLREELKRDVVVVLNKVDLAPPSLVAAWQAYLSSVYPQASIVCFSSFPTTPQAPGTGLHGKQRKKSNKSLGPQHLLDACRELVQDRVNLDSWQEKLDSEDISTSAPERHGCHDDSVAPDNLPAGQSHTGADDSAFAGVYQKFRDGILTVGCIGYPNVGKSSLLNGLVGKKVVSVSKTPGHTKHLQTIFLTPTVKLCDCPGLVFPSYVDKSLQVLSGIFPIAQVREPYSTVGYLGQRLDLPRLLRLPHPQNEGKPITAARQKQLVWSAFDICEGWAIKNGYFTAKASRPDMYRAANFILRMAVEGRLRLCLTPPDYHAQQEVWQSHHFAVSLAEQLNSNAHSGTKFARDAEDLAESDSELDEEATGSGDDGSGGGSEGEGEGTALHVTKNPFALLSDD